jgi:hypothetical protein
MPESAIIAKLTRFSRLSFIQKNSLQRKGDMASPVNMVSLVNNAPGALSPGAAPPPSATQIVAPCRNASKSPRVSELLADAGTWFPGDADGFPGGARLKMLDGCRPRRDSPTREKCSLDRFYSLCLHLS